MNRRVHFMVCEPIVGTGLNQVQSYCGTSHLKEYEALLYRPISPGAGRRVTTLKFLVGLVTHVGMPPEQHNQRNFSDHYLCVVWASTETK